MNTRTVRSVRAALLLPTLALLAAAPLSAPLSAQQALARRLGPPADLGFDHAAFLAGYEPDIEPAPARRAPAIRGQLPAAFAGLLVGTVLGVGTGLMLGLGQDDSNGFEAVAMSATLAGILGGTTYGVYKFSKSKGLDGRAGPTFGGAALGLFGGPLLWVTVPLGARWAYNRSRTDSLPAAP